MVKNLPVMWETWVWSLGWEDPLEESIATTPVFSPGESPRTEVPGRLQSIGLHTTCFSYYVTLCHVSSFCDSFSRFPFLKKKLFHVFIGVLLIYNVVLVSVV